MTPDYETYYDPGSVNFNVTVRNTGTVSINPILQIYGPSGVDITLGEIPENQSITQNVDLTLDDPGRYRYVLNLVNNETILDSESISFILRAEDVIFATINTDEVFYKTGETVAITTEVTNLTLQEVVVPVNLSITTPSGEVLNDTYTFTPDGNGTYMIKAIPFAKGYAVHEDEVFIFVEEQSDLILEVTGNLTYYEKSNLTVKVKTDALGNVSGVRVILGDITRLTDCNGEVEFVIEPEEGGVSIRAEKIGFNPDLKNAFVDLGFTFTPRHPKENDQVTFIAPTSFGSGPSIVNYEWNFDDGNITNTTNPTINHSYTSMDNYNVTLKSTDNFGTKNSTTRLIHVGLCSNLTINLNENGTTSLSWEGISQDRYDIYITEDYLAGFAPEPNYTVSGLSWIDMEAASHSQ